MSLSPSIIISLPQTKKKQTSSILLCSRDNLVPAITGGEDQRLQRSWILANTRYRLQGLIRLKAQERKIGLSPTYVPVVCSVVFFTFTCVMWLRFLNRVCVNHQLIIHKLIATTSSVFVYIQHSFCNDHWKARFPDAVRGNICRYLKHDRFYTPHAFLS